ncbi:DNL zinc finger-domain-containing protein [Syncephalis fuscata]|nr:DNL zinc finger-domain-containing protein [Syncephalis fuscata]
MLLKLHNVIRAAALSGSIRRTLPALGKQMPIRHLQHLAVMKPLCNQCLKNHIQIPIRFFSQHAVLTNKVPANSELNIAETDSGKSLEGRLLLAFTCNRCGHRQACHLSKKAYYSGVVIIQCDGCKSKHLIADHLDWFRDKGVTVEDLMKEKGESVTWLQSSDLAEKQENNIEDGTATEEPLVEIPAEDVAQLRQILDDARQRIKKDAEAQALNQQNNDK